MDIRVYIESGILEAYSLGMTNEEETLEVESLLAQYPELCAELEIIESGLEALALEQAVEPPANLKQLILSQIEEQGAPEIITNKDKKEANSPIEKTKKKKKFNFLAVVFIGLSILFGGLAVWGYSQNKEAENQINILKKEVQDCKDTQTSQQQLAETELATRNKLIALLSQEKTNKVVMQGTDKYPDLKAVVYWNSESKETLVSNLNLPKPKATQDYQLWAIVDGQPIDLGLMQNLDIAGLTQMKSVGAVQAFAITLEPKGGSATPTMENMLTMGTVS